VRLILGGLGYTAQRLARRLLARGDEVIAVTRDPQRFRSLQAIGLRVVGFDSKAVPAESTLVLSIPPVAGKDGETLHRFFESVRPKRVAYISSTGVYGERSSIDENTPAEPSSEKGVARFEQEQWISRGDWESLIVRPAAIYGPGRGAHEGVREGRVTRSAGSGIVSRIHVDDLAAVLEAGARSDLTGAWPLADDYPCPSEEVARYAASVLRVSTSIPTRRVVVSGRQVDGRKIRELLGVELRYRSYHSGVLASLAQASSGDSFTSSGA
jgi:nucleoside-diphosphate-sugar epimerase